MVDAQDWPGGGAQHSPDSPGHVDWMQIVMDWNFGVLLPLVITDLRSTRDTIHPPKEDVSQVEDLYF